MREVDIARHEVLARREGEALLEGGVEVNDNDFHIIPVHFIFPSTRRFSRHRKKGGSDPFSSELIAITNTPGTNEISGGVVVSMGGRWQRAVAGGRLPQRKSF